LIIIEKKLVLLHLEFTFEFINSFIILKIYRSISSIGIITNPLLDDERLTRVFLIEINFIEARGIELSLSPQEINIRDVAISNRNKNILS